MINRTPARVFKMVTRNDDLNISVEENVAELGNMTKLRAPKHEVTLPYLHKDLI